MGSILDSVDPRPKDSFGASVLRHSNTRVGKGVEGVENLRGVFRGCRNDDIKLLKCQR